MEWWIPLGSVVPIAVWGAILSFHGLTLLNKDPLKKNFTRHAIVYIAAGIILIVCLSYAPRLDGNRFNCFRAIRNNKVKYKVLIKQQFISTSTGFTTRSCMQSIRHCGICGAEDHLRIQSGKRVKDQENTQTSAIFGANLQPTDTLFMLISTSFSCQAFTIYKIRRFG
jgi:hypothetical protein